jgi:hypothetical protein
MRFLFVLALALVGCHHDPEPTHPKPGDLPPLPPASGTPVGYLIDSAGDLKLRDEQLSKLKEIDASLAARDEEIDTQLRTLEKPEEEEQPQKGAPPKRHNHAPGASVKSSGDASKLHERRKANDREALDKAFALLDADQQEKARQILGDRGVEAPGAAKQKKPSAPDPDGTPLPEP